MKAVEEAKKKIPDEDGNGADIKAHVKSHYSDIDFEVSMEMRPQSMESLGFRLEDITKKKYPQSFGNEICDREVIETVSLIPKNE